MWLYDIPGHGLDQVRQMFVDHCVQHGLDARLQESPRRVPHRERVERAAGRGGEELLVHGVPVVAIGDLPTDRALAVTVTLKDFDGLGTRWETITLHIREGEAAGSRLLGHVGVDWARLILADADGLNHWQHEDPVDGLADIAFWGRSEQAAASEFGAGLLDLPGEDGVYGWRDLELDEAIRRAIALDEWKQADPRRIIVVDFRPHSHHWQVMARVRASEHGTGQVEVGGARMLCTQTGEWGDGLYPAHLIHDPQGHPLELQITLATPDDS